MNRMRKNHAPRVEDLIFFSPRKSGGVLGVILQDGRMIVVPLDLFPTLKTAALAARKNWRLVGRGQGVHWPDLDLDLSAEGFLQARPEATTSARRRFSRDAAMQYLRSEATNATHSMSMAKIVEVLSESFTPERLNLILVKAKEKSQAAIGTRPRRAKGA